MGRRMRGDVRAIDQLIITLPLPSPKASKNAKHGTRVAAMIRASATKKQRENAKLVATVGLQEINHETWERASVTFRFYFPDRRRRDLINFAGALSGAIDGIVDAGLIADDDWKTLVIGGMTGEIDRENPRVELFFSKLA